MRFLRGNRSGLHSIVFGLVLMGVAAVFFYLFLIFVNANCQSSTASEGPEKILKLVHIIFRHGQRTPADTYPADPHISFDFHPYGWGQLTNGGKLQIYELGKYLRDRYDNFLGKLYTPEVCFIQTTGVDRTKMSAQLMSAGLWPPVENSKWGPLNWQPITFNYEPVKDDSLLLVNVPCPQYSIERERVENSSEIQSIYVENKELLNNLSELIGRPVKNADDVLDLQGTLRAEKDFSLQLPEWIDQYYDKLVPLSELAFVLKGYNTKLQRLKGGVLLKKILTDWFDKSKNQLKPEKRKIFLYGGHDSTISNLLLALQVWDRQIPEYASTILMELSEDSKSNMFGIEIFLKNETNREAYPLKVPGCDYFCPLTQLAELLKAVIPDNWAEECKTDDPNYVPPPPGAP